MFDASPSHEQALSDPADSAAPGALRPDQAWDLVKQGKAVLVDVRTAEERKFVGLPPRSIHVPWATGIEMKPNPDFASDLGKKVKKTDTVLLLCRSGKRSALAAKVAVEAGFAKVYNILEGFEGDLDDESRRGNFEGWRFRGLPWVQE